MKKPIIVAMALSIFAGTSGYFLLHHPDHGTTNREEVEENDEEEEKESGADRQFSMWYQARAYPNPTYLGDKYQRAWLQALELRERTNNGHSRGQSTSNWTSLGPISNIGGRILCLEIDPNNSNNLWAGSASGGIWKSTNAGSNWSAVTTNLPVLGVSSILVDPANSNTIYAGTGEITRIDTSNIGYNVWKARGTYGIGIIKSTDGGATWSQIMVKSTSQLFGIQTMIFDPTNSNTIYACATDGLYRSTNNGGTWSQILSKIYVKDVAINPSNTNQIVVGIGNMVNSDKGIYRTTNGNNASPTWVKISTGLPASFEGDIRLDNVGSGTLMASIGISSSTASTNREIYSSGDFGATWAVVGTTTGGGTTNHCSYQFWFAHTVAINPFTTDSIMFAGVSWYRYRLSNTTRTTVGGGVHADVHDIVFDPANRGRIYVCCDGGIYKSTNGGSTFSRINTGLDATQFYASLAVSRTNPNMIVGGLQDNGQVIYNGLTWSTIGWAGGDGTTCAIDPTNDQKLMVSRDARQVYRSTNGGGGGGAVTAYWGFVADSRTAFVAPLAYSKSHPDSVYLASDNIHISTDGGANWSNDAYASATNYIELQHKTAIALAVSPTNSKKVFVSTSPFAQYDNDVNNLYITGNPNILKTTTGNTPFTSIKGSLPDRFITDIAFSPTYDDSVYVTLGGFGSSHIYVTGNGGTTWAALGGSLPDVPFNALVFDPVNSKIIYAGCDLGVYVSADRGATWVDFNTGFWDATLVMDLQITADNKIVAATHGKGVFRSDLFTSSTLPVTLIDFGGVNRNNYNELHWTVAQEQNISHYELERSFDGISYQTVANKISGNSMNLVTYSHNDQVIASASEYYYRLKIVNLDGTHSYSAVVFIRFAIKSRFSVSNNPFRDFILLQYSLPGDQPIQVGLYNSSGALLKKEVYAATAGTGAYTLYGFDRYSPGLYLLKVESGDYNQTFKMVKN